MTISDSALNNLTTTQLSLITNTGDTSATLSFVSTVASTLNSNAPQNTTDRNTIRENLLSALTGVTVNTQSDLVALVNTFVVVTGGSGNRSSELSSTALDTSLAVAASVTDNFVSQQNNSLTQTTFAAILNAAGNLVALGKNAFTSGDPSKVNSSHVLISTAVDTTNLVMSIALSNAPDGSTFSNVGSQFSVSALRSNPDNLAPSVTMPGSAAQFSLPSSAVLFIPAVVHSYIKRRGH